MGLFSYILGWVKGKIAFKVHLSPTEVETGAELRNRRLNHQPDQFSLKVLSYQVKSLLSRMGGGGFQDKRPSQPS